MYDSETNNWDRLAATFSVYCELLYESSVPDAIEIVRVKRILKKIGNSLDEVSEPISSRTAFVNALVRFWEDRTVLLWVFCIPALPKLVLALAFENHWSEYFETGEFASYGFSKIL